MATILMLDATPPERSSLPISLQALGHELIKTGILQHAIDIQKKGICDLAICELLVPGGGGLTFLHRVRAFDRDFPIILTTDRPELATSPLFLFGLNEANAKILKSAPVFEFADAIKRLDLHNVSPPSIGAIAGQQARDRMEARS